MPPAHLVWFVATALMTITVLTVCTLASAGILTRRRPAESESESESAEPERRRVA